MNFQAISLVLGAIGTVLGLANTYVQLNTHRLRLRITPMSAQRGDGGMLTHRDKLLPSPTMAIEVVNLSAFPVTISSVGLKLRDGRRLAWLDPIVVDGKPWPRRLDARESVTVCQPIQKLPSNVTKAYATTACGEERFGTSPAFKEILRLAPRG